MDRAKSQDRILEDEENQCALCGFIENLTIFFRGSTRCKVSKTNSIASSSPGSRRSSRESDTSALSHAEKQQTMTASKKADNYFLLKSGKMKVKINQSTEFVHLRVQDNILFLGKSLGRCPTPESINISRILQILKFEKERKLALYVRQMTGNIDVIHLEFESLENMVILRRWIKKSLKLLQQNQQQSREAHKRCESQNL